MLLPVTAAVALLWDYSTHTSDFMTSFYLKWILRLLVAYMYKENYIKLSLDKSHYNLIMIMTTLLLQATPMTTTVCTSTARARTPTSSTYSWTGTMWSWTRRSWFRIEIEEFLMSIKTLPHRWCIIFIFTSQVRHSRRFWSPQEGG